MTAHAASVVSVPYVPPGLSFGDTYQIVFVTSDAYDAQYEELSYYDSLVQIQATQLGAVTETWGVEWSAVVATDSEYDAISHAGISSQVYLLNGSLIALDSSDFWDGALNSPINITQFNNLTLQLRVWTGMDALGAPYQPLGNTDDRNYGNPHSMDLTWANFGAVPNSDEQYPFYAVSEVLTVVPEPTTLGTILMLTGCGAVGGLARRKRSCPVPKS